MVGMGFEGRFAMTPQVGTQPSSSNKSWDFSLSSEGRREALFPAGYEQEKR